MKKTGKKGQADVGQKTFNKQMEKFGQFSQKAKTDAKAIGTLQIGKPAGKKNTDDRENINLMKQLLSQAQRSNLNQTGVNNPNLRLEFSQSTICDYLDHNKAPTGILYNPNAKVFCSYNEKGIHVWNPVTANRIFVASFELGMTQDLSKPKSFSEASRQISCICYSKEFHLYFACTKNFKLLVFNEYLNCVEEMPLDVRLVQQCIFVDETQQLITSGVQGCFIVQLQIKYAYETKQAILLDPKGDSLSVKLIKAEGACTYGDYYKFQRLGKWIRGMTLDLDSGYFVCWSDTSTYFFRFLTSNNFQNNKIVNNISNPVIFEDLTAGVKAHNVPALDDMGDSSAEEDDDAYLRNIQPRQDADSITDILFYNPMHYFVISTVLGHMLVFKWDYNVQNEKPQLMHTFKGHSRTVSSMMRIKNSYSSFVSASLDGTIRVWCLDKFIQLYTFQTDQIQSNSLGTKITDIRMLDDRVFAIMSKGPNKVTIGQISHLAKSYFISTPLITALSKAYEDVDDQAENNVASLITSFNNNSVLLLDPQTGSIQSTIYPPPTPTNIKKTLYSMALKRVFVFLESGTFCVYKVEGRETATLEKLQFPKQLKDFEGKSLTQTITSLTLCRTEPPVFDSEIFGESFKYNPANEDSKKVTVRQGQNEILASDSESSIDEVKSQSLNGESGSDGQESRDEKFLVLGLSKGSVIFVHVDSLEKIYARFNVHKQQIDHIHELKKQRCMMTLCQENELKIWGFQDGKMAIFRKFNLLRPISMLKVVENPGDLRNSQTMILMTFLSGESYYFVWKSKTKNLRITLPEKEEKYYMKEEDVPKEQVDSDRAVGAEQLKELLKKGFLMNGQVEHDEEVTTIDLHCHLQLIVSGDQDGLIKIWNFRRKLIREIKFTEPVSAVSFLNKAGDLIVGHKGKLSRVQARDYLPHSSLYEVPSHSEFKALIDKHTAEVPEDFFVLVKQQIDETKALNDMVIKPRKKVAPEQENQALMNHLSKLFQSKPKFGMPMDEFKSLLNKEDRVPKLTDKRKIVAAMQAKFLANEKANQQTQELFQSNVFKNALEEALREQERLIRVRPKRKDGSPRPTNPYIDRQDKSTSSVINTGISQKKEILPWRVGIKPNKRPGSTKAIPCNLGPAKPNHPKVGSGRVGKLGGTKTRYQMTQERIMDNIKFFNAPQPEAQMNILMVGQQMEQQSIYSERRPISRKVYRSKGTMSSIEADKAVSELQGQLQNFMSASQANFSANNGQGVMNIFSTDQLRQKPQQHNNPYVQQNAQSRRKNLASANVYGRRGHALSSVTDSMSQPDFSMGAAIAEAQSHSGHTAAGTDSVRPMSNPGYKLGSLKNGGGGRSARPGTVGTQDGKMFRRGEAYGHVMRSTVQNANGLGDDFNFNGDDHKIKVSLMGRNMLSTASAEHHPNLPFGRDKKKDAKSMTNTMLTPSNGFPARSLKKNIKVRDMKSHRNAAIANIAKSSSYNQAVKVEGHSHQVLVETEKRDDKSTTDGDQLTNSMFKRTGGGISHAQLVPKNQVPTQVIEMNENVRELMITPSMRQTDGTIVKQSYTKERTDKYSSALSGFLGNNEHLPGTDMTTK